MFHYFWVGTTILLQRVKSRFSVENFLSHSAEKIRRGPLLCFTEFPVSKTFLEKRGLGSIRSFHRNVFVSLCQKNS